MKLIVGLGNPGPEYARTRHNVGYLAIDRLTERFAPGETMRSKFQAGIIEGRVASEKCLFMKPMTYMNRSGQSVAEALRFFKLEPADCLVIVDEVALPAGVLRLRARGSAGTHNGLADIEQKIGTTEYPRLRIGVDDPGMIPRVDYVLGRFTEEQQAAINPALEQVGDVVSCWIEEGIEAAMNRFNRRVKTNAESDDESDAGPMSQASDD